MQTCISCTAVLMVKAEMRYECITHSFLINECRTREIFQLLHRQLHEKRSFYVTRHDGGRRRGTQSRPGKEAF
ncbi:hypothetical protein TNCV_3826991 [Trichonephila clavipes]|nr:hypothetical protein TNCV_3826991 [Trichonephila clavipes]